MANENLCMYCFKDTRGEAVCPHCGKDARAAVPQIQMLPGSSVYRERFMLGRALGQDASGIVYTALDTKRGGVIRIREYLPRNCAERREDGSVAPVSGMEDAFEAGMRKLRASVEGVSDPAKRHFYFEENGTAYIAQRKNGANSNAREDVDEEDDDEAAFRRRSTALYIAIAAAVVLVVAIGIIWFFNSMGKDDVTLEPLLSPSATAGSNATWAPAATPSPTPYATPTFAALVDPELSWMDYTYKGDVNKEYQQQATAAATRKPSVDTSAHYGTISNSSAEKSVKELQTRLAKLGWLDADEVSGRYNAATERAVRDFQNYVNENCSPAKKLAVDGIAGDKTQQWLFNASVSLVRPTPTPKPFVTAAPEDGSVDEKSPSKDVRAVQKKLIALGLMKSNTADGAYGAATKSAVRNFQIRVNQLQGYDVLPISGKVDELTMAYLNYYVDWWAELRETETPKPSATPTPKPTATQKPQASDVVDKNASRAEISAVQGLLQKVGLLDAQEVDGVYGNDTVSAVKRFQEWVNEQRDSKTLEVTGVCDVLTRSYLEYCVNNNLVVRFNTAAPTQKPTDEPTMKPTDEPTMKPTDEPTQKPTDAPTQAPTPDPTEVPPEQQAGEGGVSPESPKESISFVQEMLAEIGLFEMDDVDGSYGAATKEAVRRLQAYVNREQGREVLPEDGLCDSDTLRALQYYYDRGQSLIDPTEPPATVAPADPETEGVSPDSPRDTIEQMQRMLEGIGLLEPGSADGDYGARTANAIRVLQAFVNAEKGEELLIENGECDAVSYKYLKYCYDNGWNLGDSGDEAEEETPEPIRTPEPADENLPGRIESLDIYMDGLPVDGRPMELEAGSYQINWLAEGDVQSYYAEFNDVNGNCLRSAEGAGNTGFKLDTGALKPGEVYELRVGALPMNGSEADIRWTSMKLYTPLVETPEPTAAPTPRPSVSAPIISIGSSAYQQDGIPYISDSTVIFSWMADGEVDHYTVNLLYEEDGSRFSLGTISDTSKTVNADQLMPGRYRLYVGATPVGGDGDDTVWSELRFGMPEREIDQPDEPEYPEEQPTRAPDAAQPSYIDDASSAEHIQILQMALYKQGLLNADSVTVGELDSVTLEAVAAFQRYANEELGANLTVIDPEFDRYVDEETLRLLLNTQMGEQVYG